MRRRSILADMATVIAAPKPSAALKEDPHDRMHRLMKELAEVMPLTMNGRFRAIVNPDGMCWLQQIDLPLPSRYRAQ